MSTGAAITMRSSDASGSDAPTIDIPTIEIQYAVGCGSAPDKEQIKNWAAAALEQAGPGVALAIRIVGRAEGQALNERWRHAAGATNVLAFPASGLDFLRPRPLGDVLICAPVVALEARQQGKTPAAHWAHMVVHGILHLLGYDHTEKKTAHEMEALEIKLLHGLGYGNPYV